MANIPIGVDFELLPVEARTDPIGWGPHNLPPQATMVTVWYTQAAGASGECLVERWIGGNNYELLFKTTWQPGGVPRWTYKPADANGVAGRRLRGVLTTIDTYGLWMRVD